MRISDILQPQCVRAPLPATDKQQVIFSMVDLLADSGNIDDREAMKQAVWQRELSRTTGIGYGVAIPHGKCASCKKLCIAVAKLDKPVDFGSDDGRPVDLIFLLGSPLDQTGPHIQALAGISRMLTEPGFRMAVKNVKSAEELYKLIVDQEAKGTA